MKNTSFWAVRALSRLLVMVMAVWIGLAPAAPAFAQAADGFARGLAASAKSSATSMVDLRNNYGLRITTLSYVDRLPSTQTAAYKAAVDLLFTDLADTGLLTTLDAVYAPLTGDTPSDYVNLIDSSRTLTATGTVTKDGAIGVKGDGSTGYLSGVGAPSAFTKYAQDSAHISFYVTKAGNQTGHVGRPASIDGVVALGGPTSLSARLNSAASDTWTVNDSLGLTTLVRRDASTVEAYKDGVSLGTKTRASTALSSNALSFFRANTTYGSDTVALIMFGSQITATQAKQLSWISNRFIAALGRSPVPAMITLPARSQLYATTHPDGLGSDVGKGITPTGASPTPGGGIVVGIDGRGAPSDTTHDGGIRYYPNAADLSTFVDYRYNAAGSALKAHFDSLGITDTSKFSTQGLAMVSASRVTWVALDTVGSNTRIVSMDLDGSNVTSWAGANTFNGIGYDPVQDLVGAFGSAITWYNKVTGTPTSRTNGAQTTSLHGFAGPDMIWIDPTGQWMLVSGGSNQAAGELQVWSMINEWGAPVPVKSVRLTDARALEGAFIVGNLLYVNSDQYFHTADAPYPALNQLQVYDATGLLSWGTPVSWSLPDLKPANDNSPVTWALAA